MTTIALIGVTAFAVYLYITKRLERNRAENFKILYESKNKKLENLEKQIEKDKQAAHYYKTGKLSDTLEAIENPEGGGQMLGSVRTSSGDER